jgi:hypothetical protein
MTTATMTPPTRRPPTEPKPGGLSSRDPMGTETATGYSGLAVDFIDGDHVTLMALSSLHHSGAVAHRLTTLIAAGVRDISIDVRRVGAVPPPTAACLSDIAFHLSDSGGTLRLVNAQPPVAAAFAASRTRSGDGALPAR